MTTELRATPARVALLQAVADGEVTCARDWDSGKTRAQLWLPGGGTRDITKRVEDMRTAGWVQHGRAEHASMYASRPIELTAAGRAVLDHATTKEP